VSRWRWFAAAGLIWTATAQYPPDPKAPAGISGQVLEYDTGRPLRRVQVILQPGESKLPALGGITDDTGAFEFRDVPAGRYSLVAKRPGYLTGYFANTANTRLPLLFPLMPGESLKGIVIRLRPAGVISGTVRFTDAEPAVGVPVELYREYFYRGRHGFEKVATTSTDDRGAYRVYGLAPGNYYVAAAYSPPDPGAGVREQVQLDPNGLPLPEENFVTTYYPSTPRLLEAVRLRLRPGSELDNITVFLAKARTVRVRGRVLSALTGRAVSGANLRLRQHAPAGDTMVDAPAAIRMAAGGEFEILGLSPGFYLLVADSREGGERLTGRMPLTVAGQSIDNVELTVRPYPRLAGTVRVEGAAEIDFSRLRVSLEPHSDTTPVSSAPVREDGSFSVAFVPGETYDVFVLDGPPETYLKSARIGGFDVLATGFTADSGALPPMELLLSARGATISGEVADGPAKVALGATVALIPDPARGRVHRYQISSTNEYGLFVFRGVAPGRYTVVSWWDEPPCEIYDLEALEACRGQGKPVEAAEGEQKFVALSVSRAGQ
jgi:hypothetical protein